MWRLISNGLLFNISWFLIVSQHDNLWAFATLVVHLASHQLICAPSRRECLMIAGIFAAGIFLDQLAFYLQIFVVDNAAALAPFWFSCLWCIFATTICHAFQSLQSKLWIASGAGLIGALLSYSAGTALSPIGFSDSILGPVIVALCWAVIFPILLYIARRTGRQTVGYS